MSAATIEAKCGGCQATRKAKPTKDGKGLKTPMGWRAIGETLLCGECVKGRYYVRGFRVMVGDVIDEKRTRKELLAAFSAASKDSARLANWYVQRLYAADLAAAPTLAQTKDGKTKLPPCPEVDYYRAATGAFPRLAPASIVALAKMVRGWYASDRFAALVALNRSVRSYRAGRLPIEIPKQAWSLRTDADGKFVIKTQVGPGESWTIRPGGSMYSHARLKAIASGEATPLALKIVLDFTEPLSGEQRSQRERKKAWYFRISAMFPRVESTRQCHVERTLTMGHDAGSLLFGAVEESELVYEASGAELKRLIVGGDNSERRHVELAAMRGQWSRRKRLRWAKDRSRIADNRARKITEQIKLEASALARWCAGNRITSVDYDAQDRGFLPHAPWHRLCEAIKSALEREGVALHLLNPQDKNSEELAASVLAGERDG